MKHFLTLKDFTGKDIDKLIHEALDIKKNKKHYSDSLKGKTMLMLFETVSVRTRLSFEMGINQLGGYAAYYNIEESTLGKKETIEDFSKVVSRYVDLIMARVFNQEDLEKLAKNSKVPVINGMTNMYHPCQILSDILTIHEKKGKLKGLKLAYVGDGFNNITHSLLYGCAKMGIDISVACPKQFMPDKNVSINAIKFAKLSRSIVEVSNNPKEAIKDADIVYTDSWMSYRIPHRMEKQRAKIFAPYQVNKKLFSLAKKDAIFMHCLPAKRGSEVTNDIIDSKHSVVIYQAENRMHAQKALMLKMAKNSL